MDFETRNIIYSVHNLTSIRYVYLFDNTLCYTDSSNSYLDFIQIKSIQVLDNSHLAQFTGNGDLIYINENNIKLLRISREINHLKKLIQIRLYDLSFYFK